MTLYLRPLSLRQANDLIAQWHRHHKPVQGHRFSVGVCDQSEVFHGAAVVGRPLARHTDQWRVAEVTRLVTDGTPNACSMLYGSCARAAKALGFERIQTYIMEVEPGTTLRAAGWRFDGTCRAQSWSKSRGRQDQSEPSVRERWCIDFQGNQIN